MKTLHHYSENHGLSSAKELVPYILSLRKAKSVCDVGCGIGSWLKVYNDYGVSHICGLDGEHVTAAELKIPENSFVKCDFRKLSEINILHRFDIVNCLEVAEHLPKEYASDFVRFLTTLGDVIVFSAAIEGQTGENHFNENSPLYWEKLFNDNGYVFLDVFLDAFREKFWNIANIEWWYRQNMFLVVKSELVNDFGIGFFDGNSYIHPEFLAMCINNNGISLEQNIGIKNSLKYLLTSIKSKILKLIGLGS